MASTALSIPKIPNDIINVSEISVILFPWSLFCMPLGVQTHTGFAKGQNDAMAATYSHHARQSVANKRLTFYPSTATWHSSHK